MNRLRLSFLILAASAAIGCEAADERADGDVMLASREGSETRAIANDSTLTAAERELAAGHPWKATRTLTPVLRDPARRTPAAVLLAARAAAGWSGWAEVDRLLRTESWLGSQFGGAGYELLTRSALERGADTVAAAYADSAVRQAADARTRTARIVLLARALDRLNQRDSARAAYERAANGLRDVRDWLALRAAGVTDDSAARARLFADVVRPQARERIPWTDAIARERSGDLAGAAQRYASLGAEPSAFRLRLAMQLDSSARDALRDTIVRFVATHAGSADARQSVEVLDKAFPTLSPDEELSIARGLRSSGPVARAVSAYQRSLASGNFTDQDRFDYGELLIRAGRYRDATAQLAQVRQPARLAAQAAYQRGRALLLSGDGSAARSALRAVTTTYRGDTAAASASLYLLADLSTDDGNDQGAATLFRQLYSLYPTSARADDARLRAALIGLVRGNERPSALAFDSLVSRYPRSAEGNAARYWSGRAWSAAGDTARANARWRDIIAREPLSYYAGVSAKRLGIGSWAPPGGGGAASTDVFPRVATVDSVMTRIRVLEQLGMDVEARFEYDALEAAANESVDRLLATAHALREHGQTSRAIRLAGKLVERGQRDARTYRLLYPIVDQPELARQARARTIDPALVAGIIRQESSFNPRAVSVAGARGMMQVMPAVGQQVARSLGYPVWDPVLLFEPDANLEIGMAHLASSIRQYEDLVRVLAAYNAGGSRVKRWETKPGTTDPEIFAERIPFVETRDYVRIVQRNAEVYRTLYPDLR